MNADERGLENPRHQFLEAYAGYVQDRHAGRERGLRGLLAEDDGTATWRRAKAAAAGHPTPARARAARSGDPGDRTRDGAQMCCTPKMRQR